MGVPKFYRWISERYPCLSEVINENQIPEFDNLYLDMNGIIHICSHPNDDDPHFRISEEDIFKDIFHYIEVLFRMIQPRKVFYMAVDGVAPRAKMNQQRGRRFRSAREAEENEKKALSKGEVLPKEARFDSNCITPGTEFMTMLDSQLQYFITSKISSDKLWQNCSVIYSSHKTPGEGEHKIMEYIRYSRSQPGYDPNTRHCLYGLDADLIMLGLTSHEPHFSLLREEVRFGGKKKANKRTPTPEETTFHLLHLTLMREYIEYEFYDLHETLSFQFDLEAIIDDWVLMGFLVGNDFIPHLPGLHINKDALPVLYEKYKEVLPTLDGYINEEGILNLKRFQKFMSKLTEYDVEKFQELNDNLKYIRCKRGSNEEEEVNERMGRLEAFDFEDDIFDDNTFGSLEDNPLTTEEVKEKLARLNITHYEDFLEDDDDNDDSEDMQLEAEFRQHKRHYYMSKMSFEDVTPDVLRDQATNYVKGLQWILNYYYNGICSWSWYYPHHYAPFISDVKNFVDIDLTFDKGKPFKPFEQLLAVLPPLSIKLLPKPYEKLMLSENSPLHKFYPKEFSTDLNGKQQDWEAVVLIPFIDEEELLDAMKPCNNVLNLDEKSRNTHGPMFIYKYSSENFGEYKAPKYFPPIGVNHAKVQEVWREEWDIHPTKIIKGLLPNLNLDVYYPGFPHLQYIKHTFEKKEAGVKVFQQDSRGINFILKIEKSEPPNVFDLLKKILGKSIFVNWPHLLEAKVVAVSSEKSKYYLKESGGPTPIHEQFDMKQVKLWHSTVDDLESRSLKRWGIDIGETEYVIYAKLMTGRNYVAYHDGKVILEKKWAEVEQAFPYQSIVQNITIYDKEYKEYTVHEYFKPGTKVFMIGYPYYGCMGDVIEIDPQQKGRIRVSMVSLVEPNITSIHSMWLKSSERYLTAFECSTHLGISPHLFARLTGSIFLASALEKNPFLELETAYNKINIGLNLKSNKRSEEVIGFTKKSMDNSKQWLYSEQCVKSLAEYQRHFPEIFEFLNRNPTKNDIFQDEIFPKKYEEKVPELVKWLKEQPFYSAERCKWGTLFIEPSVVAQIAKEVERISCQRARSVKIQVKPYWLFKPNPLQGSSPPDSDVTYQLFDRVINVREGFSVPLGATGTVIGIQPAEKECDKMYTIFFDKPFPGGLSLAGPEFPHQCYRLTWSAMINITYGNRANGVSSAYNSPTQQPHAYDENQMSVNKISVLKSDSPSLLSVISSPDTSNAKRNLFSHNNPYLSQSEKKEMIKKNATKLEEKKKEIFSEPPNPDVLPKPMGFGEHFGKNSFRNQCDMQGNETQAQAQAQAQTPQTHSRQSPPMASVQQIVSCEDVPFVVHGNFYENWPNIRHKGLKKKERDYIPCVTYIPPKMGFKSYEIFIFLNVKKLLDDGTKLLLLPKGQVLCSTDKNGFLSPIYFEKVVDSRDSKIIFPPQLSSVYDTTLRQNSSFAAPGQQNNCGLNKGRGSVPHSTQPVRVFTNIWSQMNNMDRITATLPSFDQNHIGNTECRSGNIPVAQRFTSFNNNSNISNNGYNTNNNNDTNKQNYDTASKNRKEVTVTELFRFASLVQTPQSSNTSPISKPLGQSPIKNTYSNSQLSSAQDTSNKSIFVPRQVERKKTPKKKNDYNASTAASYQINSIQESDCLPASSQQVAKTSNNVAGNKPRRKRKSRIAANFEIKQNKE
ncbi:UNVERIFIED_CONTAM: hypothetical protein RMT77_007321 [Armadillidium vulgare]